ncbi:complex I subunit 5 family protein [Alkalibacter mobilis]|uniref:complex I subunit 5 family protein n=1 Tax=Alkalibacter mobilis TaxID=2787712 RepID=UPI00189F2D9C|nr:proton-conducting transporter membrane subunit [Alkalibacter mobilis]MBF7097075.1 proton-conducting membrane transporter [Alkalibacter mobilis]
MINLFWLVLFPVIVGSLATILSVKISKKLILLLHILMLAGATMNFYHVRTVGEFTQNVGGWGDYMGITLRSDLLAASMVFLTTFIFLATLLFNYKDSYSDGLFHFLFTSLEGLIIGIFLSNDLFNIFVLIEVSTVIISILIMYKRDGRSIYDGTMYLLINIVGMSFFLFGLGILYKRLGVIDLHAVKIAVENLDDPEVIILPYAFIITAVSLKSALMPLFSWLPKAHGTPSAPSSVSALLSGLYVKIGVYLFIRIQIAFAPTIDTSELFLFTGFITAVIGFVLAITQKDLKLILAYHTVSQIGLIMMGLSVGKMQTYWGSVYHILNHAIFKSTLFLTAGMIIDEYKTRNIYEIRGVLKRMPAVGYATIFAIFGITGAPLFNGSISKYLIAYGAKGSWVEYALVFINLGTIISFVKYSQIFPGNSPKSIKFKESMFKNSVVVFLGFLCLAGGLFARNVIMIVFDVGIAVDPLSYWLKVLVFAASLMISVGIYQGLLKKKKYLSLINSLELSFNGVCLSILLFFSTVLFYLKWTV